MPTDTERLDWLEKNQQGIYRVTNQCRGYRSTMPNAPWEIWDEFVGWSVSCATDELPTVREAIDAAMGSPVNGHPDP